MQTQYQVPQFIDIEDKIVGPLTLKQFFIIAAGLGIAGLLFMTLRLSFAIVLGIPIITFAFALALVKMHGMPLWKYIGAALSFASKPQEYFWKK